MNSSYALFMIMCCHGNFLHPPDNVEDCRYKELIVDGHSDVTWLVESRGDGADSIAQVHSPKQEQELS